MEKAAEGGDTDAEGETNYRIGLTYDHVGEPTESIIYFKNYLDICRRTGNKVGLLAIILVVLCDIPVHRLARGLPVLLWRRLIRSSENCQLPFRFAVRQLGEMDSVER